MRLHALTPSDLVQVRPEPGSQSAVGVGGMKMGTHDGDSRIRFADFEADLATGELLHSGRRIGVQRKPFQILELLLRADGALVPREEIYDAVWPGVHVDRQRCLNVAIRKLRVALNGSALVPQLVETLGNRGYRLTVPVASSLLATTDLPARPDTALAVLPFENLSEDADGIFAYGMTEELIAQLGRLCKDARVIAPPNSLHFPGTTKTPIQVAEELRADYALSGTLLRISGRLRITAKLIRTLGQSCVWSQSYLRNDADILLVQEEIARNIARAIFRALPARDAPQAHLSTQPATYEKYLRACFFSKQLEPRFDKAVQLYEQVIREDPNFAPAHANLALLYHSLGIAGVLPPHLAHERLTSAAAHALALCEETADAHTALGYTRLYYDADLAGAETSFLRALEINPSAPMAYIGYAAVLTVLRRREQAVSAGERARELDPLSPQTNINAALALYGAGRWQEALQCIQNCLDMDPGSAAAHTIAGWIWEVLGKVDRAAKAYRAAVARYPGSPMFLAHGARGLALTGDTRGARQRLQELLDLRTSRYVSPFWLALVYLALGQEENALACLETSVRERCAWRVFLGVDPKLSTLAGNSRFERLSHKIRLATTTRYYDEKARRDAPTAA
jgi:TolB-like protein/Tfp pilus assembly protein PilF